MNNYKEVCNELKEKGIISSNDIFEYQYCSLKDIYNNYFEYCHEFLIKISKKYNIEPSRIYFRNDYAINARAGISKGYFVIGINMGTIQKTYELFFNKNKIFEEEDGLKKIFGEVAQIINIPLGFLMFQLSSLFTFHHELAHLIQKPTLLTKGLTEQYIPLINEGFDIERHVLEFDADCHAAVSPPPTPSFFKD